MRLGVDLDGVIADSTPEMKVRMKRDFGVEVKEEAFDWDYETVKKLYDIPDDYIKKMFNDVWFWSKSIVHAENVEQLRIWRSEGHEIHIITGRPQAELALVTRRWLKNKDVPFDHLSFEPLMYKVDYLKKHDISVMFEDMFFEANKIGSYGLTCFVIRRHWNSSYESRVTNPLVSYIDELADANDFIGGLHG